MPVAQQKYAQVQPAVAPFSKHRFPSAVCRIICQIASIMADDGVVLITVGLKVFTATEFPYMDITDLCDRLNFSETFTMNILMAFCRG